MTPTELETTTTAEQPEAQTHDTPHEHTHDHEHDHSHSHDEGDLAPGLHTHNHQVPAMNPELAREITVEVPADEVSKAFRAVTKRYQKLARIPGFRAGKVPESLIKTKFAKEVRQEVLETLVSERFKQAIDARKMTPASQPQLVDMQWIDGQPLTFKAAFEAMPEIDITDYESVRVEKPDTTLTAQEFDGELARVLDSHAVVEPIEEDRTLVDGDWAEIEFKGKIKPLAQTVTEDGVESAEAEAAPITGDDVLVEINGKNTLPAFNEALRGTKVGQELEFEVSYPADFGERKLAGQTVGYDVKVKAIKKKTYPERNAEFASQLGMFESWEEFEEKLREMATDRKATALENQAKDRMVGELIQRYQFPVPEAFVQQQIEARLDRGLRALAQQGMSTDDMRKLDFVRLREAQRDQAVNEVRASMILDRVAEAESVEVSDKELDDEVLMLSYQAHEPYETRGVKLGGIAGQILGTPEPKPWDARKSFEALRTRLEGDGGLEKIREQMKREKTGSLLYAKLSS